MFDGRSSISRELASDSGARERDEGFDIQQMNFRRIERQIIRRVRAGLSRR
jgi:hypothetical protein